MAKLNVEKENFLLNDFVPILRTIPPDQLPLWGKMNLQQMVEHMTDSFRIANEKTPETEILTPAERLPAMYQFMMSEKPFKENTKNALMGEEPAPVRGEILEDAILELDQEIADFYSFFKDDQDKTTRNAFFGDLNYAEWVQLLHKHSLHHLRQFEALINKDGE